MFFRRKKKQPLPTNDDLNVFELDDDDDFNFGLDDDDDTSKKPFRDTRKRARGFRRGFFDDVNKSSMRRGFVSSVLPDGYSHLYTALNNTKDVLKIEAGKLREENADVLLRSLEQAERNLPRLEKRLSKKRYEKLEARIKEQKEKLEYEILEKKRMQQGLRSDAEDEDRIRAALLDVHSGIEVQREQREDERVKREDAIRQIETQRQDRHYNVINARLAGVQDSLSQHTSFQEQVDYRFQKKSLEIQHRSLFMQRDIRRLQSTQLELSRRAYEALVYNTGLTERERGRKSIRDFHTDHLESLVKETGGEDAVRGFGYLEKAVRGMTRGLLDGDRDHLPQYLAAFYPEIRRRIRESVSESLRSGSLMADMAMDKVDDLKNGIKDKEQQGIGLGMFAGNSFAQYVAPRVGRLARPLAEKYGERLGGRHHLANYMINNAPTMIQEFAEDFDDGDSRGKGLLRRAARAFSPRFSLNNELKDGSYATLDRATGFNHLTQRSLVEIIPGYLSRILHEARMARTGDTSLERVTYDVTKGQFIDKGEARKLLRRRVVPETQRANAKVAMDSMFDQLDPEKGLSDKARNAFREQFMKDAGTNDRFNPERYRRGEFSKDLDESTRDEMVDFINKAFDFDEKGKLVRRSDNLRRLTEIDQKFTSLRHILPDPRKEIERLHQAGHQELLREMGLIYTERGRDYTDFDKVWEMFRDDIAPATPGAPSNDPSVSPSVVEMQRQTQEKATAGLDALTKRRQKATTQDEVYRPNFILVDDYTAPAAAKTRPSGEPTAEEEDAPSITEPNKQSTAERRKSFFKRFKRDRKRRRDLYTKEGVRTLLKRDMLQGRYFDVKSQKTIFTPEDIKGEVVDDDGNVILSAKEFEEGLYNIEEERVTQKAHIGERYFAWTKRYYGKFPQMLKKLVSGIGKKAWASVGSISGFGRKDKDAYLPGEDTPRIRIKGIKEGWYTNKKGKVIRFIEDIDQTIFDRELNVVISEEELSQLVNVDGTAHKIATQRGGIGKWLKRKLKQAAKGYWNWTKNYYKKLPRRLLNFGKDATRRIRDRMGMADGEETVGMRGVKALGRSVGRFRSEYKRRRNNFYGNNAEAVNPGHPIEDHEVEEDIAEPNVKGSTKKAGGGKGKTGKPDWASDPEEEIDEDDIKTPTDGILHRMWKLQQEEATENDEPRKGSWRQILRDRRAKRKEKAKGLNAPGENTFTKMLGSFKKLLTGGLGGLLGLGGDDDEDDGDIIVGGGMDREGRDGKDRKPKKAGFFKRLKDGLMGREGGSRTGRALRWFGQVGRAALGWGGKAALAVGTASAATLGLPATLAIGAATVAGIGGYALWRHYRDKDQPLTKRRLLHYGIDPENQNQVAPVLALEEMALKHLQKDGEMVLIKLAQMDIEKVLKEFNVDKDDEGRVRAFSQWFLNRFVPVFQTHATALNKISTSISLHDMDADLNDEQKRAYLQTSEPEADYLSGTASPFDAEAELPRQQEQAREVEREIDANAAPTVTPVPPSSRTRAARQQQRRSAGPGQGYRRQQAVQRNAQGAGANQRQFRSLTAHQQALGIAPGVVHSRRPQPNQVSTFTGTLSPLRSMRLYAYGLSDISDRSPLVRAILTVETEVAKYLKVDRQGKVTFTGNATDILSQYSELLGSWWDEEADRNAWIEWFDYRFIPVIVAYREALYEANPRLEFATSGTSLEKVDQYRIANRIVSTRTGEGSESQAVWLIPTPPWGANHDSDTAKEYAKELRDKLNEESLEVTPVQRARNNLVEASTTTAQQQQAIRRQANHPNRPQNQPSVFSNQYFNSRSNNGNPNLQIPRQSGGSTEAMGNSYGTFAKGNGGMWEEIPLPEANRSREAAMPTLRAAGAMTGVDPELLATFAQIESNFDYEVKAKSSSATGWFQFINSTWDGMLENHASTYGIPMDGTLAERRNLRKDPRINSLMGAEFLKANHGYLKSRIDRNPTDTDLYLAHFLGPYGALKLLREDRNANAAAANSDAAGSNPTVFYHPDGRAKTIGEIQQWADSKVAPGRRGGSNVASFTTPESEKRPQVDASGAVAMQDIDVAVGPTNSPSGGQRSSGDPLAVEAATAWQQDRSIDEGVERSSDPATSRAVAVDNSPVSSITNAQFPEPKQERQPQEERQRRAEREDRRQAERVEKETTAMTEVANVAAQQLETQREMRDYLKTLAERFTELPGSSSNNQSAGSSNASSGSNSASGRRTGGNNPPISMGN